VVGLLEAKGPQLSFPYSSRIEGSRHEHTRSNRGAIVGYGQRYREGLRVATSLAESAVNSVVGKRMVKKQQMRWTLHGAHTLMQVRTAELNGELRDRLRAPFRQPAPSVPSPFNPKPPLLRAAYPPQKLPVALTGIHTIRRVLGTGFSVSAPWSAKMAASEENDFSTACSLG
jgi:hypothetical protein